MECTMNPLAALRPLLFAAAVALAAVVAAPAAATQDGWPALFDVTGVAAGDALNVRSGPGTRWPVVATLPRDARGVEVVEPNPRQTWGRINTVEGTGWVSLAFLARRPGQWDGAFPEIAACAGTEPFWSLTRAEGRLSFRQPDAQVMIFEEAWTTGSIARRDRFSMRADGPAATLTAVLIKAECSDGMSDRLYGIGMELLIDDGKDPRQWSGCCTLSR
jgi:uncharacterized membrane protein